MTVWKSQRGEPAREIEIERVIDWIEHGNEFFERTRVISWRQRHGEIERERKT